MPGSGTGDKVGAKRERVLLSWSLWSKAGRGGRVDWNSVSHSNGCVITNTDTFSTGKEWGSLKIPKKKPALQRERRAAWAEVVREG